MRIYEIMYATVLDSKQATNELAVILLLGQNNGLGVEAGFVMERRMHR